MQVSRAAPLAWLVLVACTSAEPPRGLTAPDAARDAGVAAEADADLAPADAAPRPDVADLSDASGLSDVGDDRDAHTAPDATPPVPTPSAVLMDIPAAAGAYAAAACDRQSRCVVLPDWRSVGECEADEGARALAQIGLLRDLVADGRATFDDAAFALCLQQLAAADCTRGAPACELLSQGLGTAASACRVDEECAAGLYCTGAFEAQCGSCESPGALGTPCRDDRACASNLRCSTRGVCAATARIGRGCGSDLVTDVVCMTGTCLQGVCRAFVAIGGACDASMRPCDAAVAACVDGVCTAASRAADGAPCDGARLCHDDAICVEGTCRLRLREGESCRSGDPIPCGAGLICAADISCIRRRGWEICRSDDACEPGLRCAGPRNEMTCAPLVWEGCD